MIILYDKFQVQAVNILPNLPIYLNLVLQFAKALHHGI